MCNLFRRLTLSLLVGISALVFTAISINTAFAIEPVEVAKLTASDGAAGDYFGSAVALDGDTAVIGATDDGDLGYSSGSAYVFRWDGATWVEHKLTASDGAAYDRFGGSVAVAGDTVVIGAAGDDDLGGSSGSAYVFRWDGATWVEHKLTASDGAAYDLFGGSVAVAGDTAVIGAYGDDEEAGSAYVFRWDGATWVEHKLTASDGAAEDRFGYSVAVDGDTAVIGAPQDDDLGDSSGSVYVFNWDGATWVEHKLTASDGDADDHFGRRYVAVDDDTIVIGAGYADDPGTDSGSAYVFRWDGATWVEHKLTVSDGAADDYFGSAVALDGDTAVIGASGDDDLGDRSGSAYVFRWDGATWVEHKLTASDGAANDSFGTSVAVDGDTAVVGTYGDDEYAGSAYVFALDSAESVSCVGFDTPLDDYPVTLKGKRPLPLRAELFDANDNPVTDDDLVAPPFAQVYIEAGEGGEAVDITNDLLPTAPSDEGNQFVFTGAGVWQYILKTTSYTAPGTYSVVMESGAPNEYVFDQTCLTQFIVQ